MGYPCYHLDTCRGRITQHAEIQLRCICVWNIPRHFQNLDSSVKTTFLEKCIVASTDEIYRRLL
ncbi:hypothetical protein KUTeg_009470, partial [Tegillarca granosa]